MEISSPKVEIMVEDGNFGRKRKIFAQKRKFLEIIKNEFSEVKIFWPKKEIIRPEMEI